MDNLINKVEEIIKRREMLDVSFTLSTPPRSPIIVVYTDDEVVKFHDTIVNTLQSVWMTYDRKVIFSKLSCDGIETLSGLSGKESELNSLFSLDYGLTDFDYSTCCVFTVVSSFNVSKESEITNRINEVDTFVSSKLNGHKNNAYLVAFLDVKNTVSAEFRRDLEQSKIDSAIDKKVFIVENRRSDGADLTDEISMRRMYKNLSYIIRMSQLQNIGIKNGCHLIGSQEVHKPYYEMAAGVTAGVLDRIKKYLKEKNDVVRYSSSSAEEISRDLGFFNGEFEYIDSMTTRMDNLVPSDMELLSLPVAIPEEPQLDSTAAVFNRQTMGTFYAYTNTLNVNQVVSIEEFKLYLKKKLGCFDILSDFGSQTSIDSTIRYIRDRILSNDGEHLPPIGYVKNIIKNKSKDELIEHILRPALLELNSDANNYMRSLSTLCAQVFSHGREEIFEFYRSRVFREVTEAELSSIDKICDPENWIISFIEKIVENDTIYSGSLEQELIYRMEIEDTSAVSTTVVKALTTLDDYFVSNYNYNENVDVGGRIIFMDAESDLWDNIKNNLGAVRIFDMPENNEINLLKIYTYQ